MHMSNSKLSPWHPASPASPLSQVLVFVLLPLPHDDEHGVHGNQNAHDSHSSVLHALSSLCTIPSHWWNGAGSPPAMQSKVLYCTPPPHDLLQSDYIVGALASGHG